jgi:hypothetical protein
MDKKQLIALVRSDIEKHQTGEIDKMHTISQYAKLSNMTIKEITNLLLGLTEREQAYCYNHEDSSKD